MKLKRKIVLKEFKNKSKIFLHCKKILFSNFYNSKSVMIAGGTAYNFFYKILSKNKIFAAGLDVFENEPLHMRNQLRKLKNCEFSSHNAFNTLEAVKRAHRDSVFNLINGLKIKK